MVRYVKKRNEDALEISAAVAEHVRGDPYAAIGSIEELTYRHERLVALVGRLVENANLPDEKLERVLDYDYLVDRSEDCT